jgi:hypothetical protein
MSTDVPVTSSIVATEAAHFPRRLRFTDRSGQTQHVDEAGMLAITGPKIVLGEPGMGKTELIHEVGRALGLTPVTAVRFMLSRNPEKFVKAGAPLLIDGLDEAIARRDGDAVDRILAQVEKAGTLDILLGCRTREWQARTVHNLHQIYGAEPTVFSIEPLTRDEACAFLSRRYPGVDAEHILEHLDAHRLTDLYGNPLMLGLLGRVAQRDTHLPANRAALFHRVCEIIWPEHDPDRQDIGLGQISEDQALDAAGAISAALLFAGAEAVSLAGLAQLQEGDLRLADLEALPRAGRARSIFASKLFHSVGTGRAKPIHRVIAEYLGARWLARQATTPRVQRRLLRQFQGTGGVPSSLRGLHAWLAFHSPAMAEQVIAADPYGVLRYGETSNLPTSQAECLLEALQALAQHDPFFRASDWDRQTAPGLMVPELRDKIEAVIGASDSNWQLRSLLIETLRATPLAADLASTLEAVMFSIERSFHERSESAEALFVHRDRPWWRQAITRLGNQGTDNSTRLARSLIEMIDVDVDDVLLVSTLYAEMGITIRPLPRETNPRRHTLRSYSRVIEQIPAKRLASVLDLLVDFSTLVGQSDRQTWNDLGKIVERLVLRAIDERVVGPADASALWEWLSILERAGAPYGAGTKLRARLEDESDLRHSVQLHALYTARRKRTIWHAEVDLQRRLVGLRGQPNDIIPLLERLADGDNHDQTLREEWRDLMTLSIGTNGFDPALLTAGLKFQRGDVKLQAFVEKLENPKKPAWEVKQEQESAKRERKRQIAFESQRRRFRADRAALRAGELGAITQPAEGYLGRFLDLAEDKPAAERLTEWLGSELRDDALVGFDAVLRRTDLPTSQQVAQAFANDEHWTYSYAIMAGLLARHRAGQSLVGIASDILLIGLLLCYNDHGLANDDDLKDLQKALEVLVIPTPKDRETFARLWVEPSLASGREHVSGVYMLAHDKEWRATGGTLAGGWLAAYPQVPQLVEFQIVDCLTHSASLETLAPIANARSTGVFHNFEHMLAWLAIDVLVRFETVLPDLAGIGARNPEFIWFLRDRFYLERHGAMLPVGVAQAKWIISEFRKVWPYAVLEGSGTGDTNPYDATEFLRALLGRLAGDSSLEASAALEALIGEPEDSYSEDIRHMAAEQLQKRAEENFSALAPAELGELLADGPPSNADDLKSLVLEEIAVAQKKLTGDDIDQVRDFWGDNGIPYNENRCRDRFAAMIGPELARYDVQRITEADMPKAKRADLAFARGQLQLPMEVKGQWHPEVWDAASGQLDAQYLIDWRSEQRGIYCVLWFGNLPSDSRRRLQAPPKGTEAPKTAEEMREMLVERISDARRAQIDVVVLDLTAGKP